VVNRFASSAGVAAALLAGCGGSQLPIDAPGAMQQSRAIATQAKYGGSWMLPEAKNEALVYASADRYRVEVYSLFKGNHVGELSGLPAEPLGLCNDPSGNIYVTMQGDGESLSQSYVYEYAHGGTHPIATFHDPGLANGCAVDPTTGNLAVTNYFGSSGTNGNIAVYDSAQEPPKIYADVNFPRFLWCTYDSAGNLFADGASSIVDELPSGADALTEIQLSKSITSGSVQWLGKYLVIAGIVGTRGPNPIHKVRVSGGRGDVHGTILLSSRNDRSATGDIQFWVEQRTIIGPGHVQGGNGLLQFWKYPKGGMATEVIKPRPKAIFSGVTVSQLLSVTNR